MHVSVLRFLCGLSPGDVSAFTFLSRDTTQVEKSRRTANKGLGGFAVCPRRVSVQPRARAGRGRGVSEGTEDAAQPFRGAGRVSDE